MTEISMWEFTNGIPVKGNVGFRAIWLQDEDNFEEGD